MALAKRIFLFLAVNFLVMGTVMFLLNAFGVQPYLNERGLDLESLAIFCLLWGMTGSIISLLISKQMAKWMMGVRIIPAQTQDPALADLIQKVAQLSRSAGLPKSPEVGIYESPEVNAFATGPSKSRSLVAVSTGLLRRLNSDEVEGVLGHEIAHIANGDMVTMTLVQGIVNAFVMFLARVIAFALVNALRGRDSNSRSGASPFMYHMVVMVLEIILMFVGMLVVAAFSRLREYRADAGGARLAGRDKMIAALQALQRTLGIQDPIQDNKASFQALKISNKRGMLALFSTHPPLDERIARLRA